MRSRLQRRTVTVTAAVVVLGFIAAAIALGERGVGGSDIALPIILATLATVAGTAFVLRLSLRDPVRTVGSLKRAAEAMAGGALDQRVPDSDRSEVGELATSFNEMSRAVRAAFAGLEAERHRFVAVMNTTINGVIALDRDLHLRYLNPASERILSMPLEDAIGKPFLYAVRDPDLHKQLLRVRETHRFEVMAQRVGPEHRELQVLLTPLEGAGDWAFLVVLTDLSEVRRLEAIRREFVTNVSHELQTPLAALRAAVETLQAGADRDPEAAPRFFERIVGEVDRLTALVDQLLVLSRVEAQTAERLSGEPVDLAEVVREATGLLMPQAERAGVELSVEADPTGPVIIGDREQLQRAVTNLVHNAIKFTPSGGSVSVSTLPGPELATITVRDTGIGIRPADQEHVFDRFFKAERSRSSEGSGLGLAIVKHIVQAHGGEVTVESSPGRGSTFRCAFPLPAEPSEPSVAYP